MDQISDTVSVEVEAGKLGRVECHSIARQDCPFKQSVPLSWSSGCDLFLGTSFRKRRGILPMQARLGQGHRGRYRSSERDDRSLVQPCAAIFVSSRFGQGHRRALETIGGCDLDKTSSSHTIANCSPRQSARRLKQRCWLPVRAWICECPDSQTGGVAVD